MKGFIEVKKILSDNNTLRTESIRIDRIIGFYGYFSSDKAFWGKRDFCKIVFKEEKLRIIKVAHPYEEIKQKIKQAQEQK